MISIFKAHFGWCRKTGLIEAIVRQGDEATCPGKRWKQLGPVLVQMEEKVQIWDIFWSYRHNYLPTWSRRNKGVKHDSYVFDSNIWVPWSEMKKTGKGAEFSIAAGVGVINYGSSWAKRGGKLEGQDVLMIHGWGVGGPCQIKAWLCQAPRDCSARSSQKNSRCWNGSGASCNL